jgi:spore maturation protein CgeB
MRVVMFYHSLCSDWNHGNAHFLRGVASELIARGHSVDVFEPHDSWSRSNLVAEHGEGPLAEFQRAYPMLEVHRYDSGIQDPAELLEGADLVIVHEWNRHDLVSRIGRARRDGGDFILLFHDTHHRCVTEPAAMAGYDLRDYDGVLAFGEVIRRIYLERGWCRRAWTWHEAADTRVFRPFSRIDGGDEDTAGQSARDQQCLGDLVWIGNWGDDERAQELQEFLLDPVRHLRLDALVHGVRYPPLAKARLMAAGIVYGGWLPNYRAPEVFARHRLTVHVPRRPYVAALPGIPTIRMFEALACGIPLVSAPWEDAEQLFTPGRDFLVARDGACMREHLRDLLNDPAAAADVANQGRETILARHTCRHRVDELVAICHDLAGSRSRQPALASRD